LYRAALAAGGANAQINFQLAEILYRQGDLTGARERYFSAVELDENFVEARANLGCVLAELGRDDLAAAAFRGALKLHPDYAEVRLHLATLLKRQGHIEEAEEQFQLFQELMPEYQEINLR
jgi:tetratricopeptide (TPR) repeat protein